MSTSQSMKQISASIPDKLYDQLVDLSDVEGRSFSNLVSYLLEQAMDDRYRLNKRLGRIEDSEEK